MGGFRCAGWARNPKGPQVTPFCHQMGRRGTIWDFKTGIRLRIPARISPWGSRGLNPSFFLTNFGPQQWENANVCELLEIAPHNYGRTWGPMRPHGPHGAPRGPKVPQGAPWGPQGPPGPLLGAALKGRLHWCGWWT